MKTSDFFSKKAWQRSLIMAAGIIFNLALGFFLCAITLWMWGEQYLPAQNAIYGVYADSLGRSIGLRDGDQITGVNGKELKNLDRLNSEIISNEGKALHVIRNGKKIRLPIPEVAFRELAKRRDHPIAFPAYPIIVDSLANVNLTRFGGLQKNDEIIGLNGEPTHSLYALNELKRKFINEEVTLAVLRNNQDTVIVLANVSPDGSIGFCTRHPEKFLRFATVKYTFIESLPAGVTMVCSFLAEEVHNLKLLFPSKEIKPTESSLSLVAKGYVDNPVWDWQHFWAMTAVLSIIWAFMNMLPIPLLDNGYILLIGYELITRKKPGERFLASVLTWGSTFIIAIFVYSIGLCIWRCS